MCRTVQEVLVDISGRLYHQYPPPVGALQHAQGRAASAKYRTTPRVPPFISISIPRAASDLFQRAVPYTSKHFLLQSMLRRSLGSALRTTKPFGLIRTLLTSTPDKANCDARFSIVGDLHVFACANIQQMQFSKRSWQCSPMSTKGQTVGGGSSEENQRKKCNMPQDTYSKSRSGMLVLLPF